MVQNYYSSSDDISMSEHSDSDISPCINTAGGRSSLLGASNSFGQGPKSSPKVPKFFFRNKQPSKLAGFILILFGLRICPAVEDSLSGPAALAGADSYFLEASARLG